MRVLAVVLALVASSSATISGGGGGGGGGSGFQSGQGGGFGGSGQGVSYQTGRGGGGELATGFSTGGRGDGFRTGTRVGSGATLDSFGSPLGAGAAAGGVQRGTAQVSIFDSTSTRDQDQQQRDLRKYYNGDAGAGRQDNQERRGDLRESSYNRQDSQAQGSGSKDSRSYDQNYDQAAESSQQQNDLNDKHGVGLEYSGRYDRQDVARNNGDKALAARKNAFARQNTGFENIDYGFKKNFDTNFNERGGFKEAVGQDNNNLDVYEEKQRDNRFSKGELDAFRRSRDNNAFRKESDWLSNAAQKQKINNQYGAADRLQNAAEQQNVDWNAILDRKNDVFWHRDNAQDKAIRQANDVAEKQANQQKNAIAQASGKKGVKDNKYYGGGSYGKGGRTANVGLGTGGAGGIAGTGTGTGSYSGGGGGGPVVGGGIVSGGGNAQGEVVGRQEGSGGDYVNQYQENARQSDLANQQQSSRAQSDATALNDYSRGRGVDDSIEVNGQRQGKWAKDRAGLRDANSQGYNGANADVAKAAELADNAKESQQSRSNLNAANKNLQAQELDRVNWKRNQVDSNQKIRKQKKFYHDKNEGGFNNEALNYNRNKGNQDWGEEQQAQKEARTRYNNAADDAKVNQRARSYNNLDARRISNANAVARRRDNGGGWQTEKRLANADAKKNRAAYDNGRQNSEFDSFASDVNNRNQKLWDQARKDLSQRSKGADKDRTVNAAFVFTPENQGNSLGLGGAQTFGGGGTGGTGGGGGSGFGGSTFGRSTFGGGRGGGGGRSGSSFRGGFGSEVGGFMAPIGGSQFGADFGGSGSTSFGGSTGRAGGSGLYGGGGGGGTGGSRQGGVGTAVRY